MARQMHVAANLPQDFNDYEKQQARDNISATRVRTVTDDRPAVYAEALELLYRLSNRKLTISGEEGGLLVPEPVYGEDGYILEATRVDGGSGVWTNTRWVPKPRGGGKLMRNEAEMYMHHLDGSDQYWHVRNVKNNCINHVAVENLASQVCGLTIEAPTDMEQGEEQNYYVLFECTNSSGGTGVTVENTAPRIDEGYSLSKSYKYIKTALSSSPSDADPIEAVVKDYEGNNRYLQINQATYPSSNPSNLAGPLLMDGASLETYDVINRWISFSGTRNYMIHVIGPMWYLERF